MKHIAGYDSGGDRQPMVFLHNAGSDHTLWDRQLPAFASHYRTIAVDLPGFGGSQLAEPPVATLDYYADFVDHYLRHHNLQNVVLVGHCIGAAMALAYALRSQERLGALLLFNVATERGMRAGMAGPLINLLGRAPWLSRPLATMMEHAPRTVLKKAMRGQYAGPTDDPYLHHLVELNKRRHHTASLRNLGLRASSYRVLDSFVRPTGFPRTMLLWGEHNFVLPYRTSEGVRKSLAADHEVLVTGAGHLCMRERADWVNEQLRGFLASI